MNAVDPAKTGQAFQGLRVVVMVTGGIAAFKTATIVSRLVQDGAEVTVAMTEAAKQFVAPLTFQSLSGRPVYSSIWEHIESQDPQHIATAAPTDAFLVAPCTMDCLARLASGRANDIVTLILAAVDRSEKPVLLAPAMNEVMWNQPSTQRNIETLRTDGFHFVGPATGWQACRTVGVGRMSEPDEILEAFAGLLVARSD